MPGSVARECERNAQALFSNLVGRYRLWTQHQPDSHCRHGQAYRPFAPKRRRRKPQHDTAARHHKHRKTLGLARHRTIFTPLADVLAIAWMVEQITLKLWPALPACPGRYQHKWHGRHDGQKCAYNTEYQGDNRKNAPEYGLGLLKHETSMNREHLQDTMPATAATSSPCH